jgi:hypothetical protein
MVTFKGKCAMTYKTVTDGVILGKTPFVYLLFSGFKSTFKKEYILEIMCYKIYDTLTRVSQRKKH